MDIIKELKKDGMLLKKVPKREQTTKLCEVAVKQNPLALQYASRKCLNSKICLTAVKKNGQAFRYVPDQFITKHICELAVESDAGLLKDVPENFRTSAICIKAIKKDVSALSLVPYEKRHELFENNTEIELIEKIVAYNPEWLMYMPDRADVRTLCIKCMEKDFSIAQYMPKPIKVSEDILNYQKSCGKVHFMQKYYNHEENKFNVKIKVVYGQKKSIIEEYKIIEKWYGFIKKFENFDDFYNFLEGDLSDTSLRNYSFHGIDLRKYNIDGAVIHNKVLQSQGLYDGTYFESIKKSLEKSSNKITEDNEIMIPDKFYYPKPVDDDEHEQVDFSHIPFFYISDIHLGHRVDNKFKDAATKDEIHSYVKFLARSLVSSIGTRPLNSYLLIAGDTSSFFELAVVFYTELIRWWDSAYIVVVSGNHELLDPDAEMEDNINIYRKFFTELGITFLQNDLLCVEGGKRRRIFSEAEILKMSNKEIQNKALRSPVIILGGIGFSGLNKKFNASTLCYGKSFDELSREEALKKDIYETNRFDAVYTKVLESLGKSRVIVLTHTKKPDWNANAHNPNWIYVNGHSHRNFYEANDRRKIYADNQIGYKAVKMGLKYFYCDNDYDIFAYYQDGIYEITKEQYIDFNRGKQVTMSFKRNDGTIYMLKKDNIYLFLIYCKYSSRSKEKSLYLLNGGKLCKLRKNWLEELSYYHDNLKKYADNVNQLLYRYIGCQQKLSEFIKLLGGSGKIHGCIVDVDRPNKLDGFSYCHLFVNPIDGKVTPYFAHDVKSRIVYKDFKTMLQAHDSCRQIFNKYLRIEKEAAHNLPIVQYTEQMEEWENEDALYDEGSYIYKISRIIKSLQYCIEKNIVRLWNEELLNYNLVNQIKQTNQIEEIIDDRLMIETMD